MSNTIVTSTLSDAILKNGDKISGTWTDTYNSTGTLIGVSAADVTLSDSAGIITTYETAHVYIGAGQGSAFNYEIELTETGTNSALFLDWENGTEAPGSLFTGKNTVQSSGSTYIQYTSYQKNGTVSSSLSSGGSFTNEVTCFMAGTMILTPAGEVEVETLQAGDMVLTADGKALPVRWLGRSTVVAHFADPLRAAPILIKAGALGEKLPARDLRVSPAHALLLEGRLVEAGTLVNNVSILREAMPERFTYYHVELPGHELLVSNGVASESFVDNVNRMNFDNWAEHEAAQSMPPIVEMALPRVKAARQLPQGLRTKLAARVAQAA